MKTGENLQTPTCNPVVVDQTGEILAAANPTRGQLLVFAPPGSAVVYLRLGAAATTTTYTLQIVASASAGAYYEVPMAGRQCYTGVVSAICAAGQTATLLVTELSK